MPETESLRRAPRWSRGKVFSLELRDGSYALFQMLEKKGQIAVFDEFRDHDEWAGLSLRASSVLFFDFALSTFFRRSPLRHHPEIAAVEDVEYPPPHVPRIGRGSGCRKVTFWSGTSDERTVLTLGSGHNSLVSYHRDGFESREQVSPISSADYDKYVEIEMTGLADFPSLNERILLCRLFGGNFDPDREIAFDRPLPVECKTYIDIIGGVVRLSDLGY